MFTDIYISPHMDDVALSCTGTILSKKKQSRKILVITVFCSDRSNNNQKVNLGKLLPGLVNDSRRLEDSAAMEMMGVKYTWFDFPDAILRSGPLRIFSSSGNFRRDLLCKELFSVILDLQKSYPSANFYFPLGIGHHMDHLVLSSIGLDFARRNLSPTYFYEDIPYNFVDSLRKSRFMKISNEIFIHGVNDNISKFDPQKELDNTMKIVGKDVFPEAKSIIARTFIKRHLFSMAKESSKISEHRQSYKENLEPIIEQIDEYFEKKMQIISEYKTQIPLLFSSSVPCQDTFRRLHPKNEKNEAIECFWLYKI